MSYFLLFFAGVAVLALVLNAVDKIKSYRKDDKSVWMDGDSVHVKKGRLDASVKEDKFMTRIQ